MSSYSTYTSNGSRSINEDAIGVFKKNNKSMFILCDGLGGHGMGDVASKLVVDVFCSCVENDPSITDNPIAGFSKMFHAAQDVLLAEQMSRKAKNKMKTTAVACFQDGKKLYVAHVGDSRAYIFRRNKIYKRTLDHSIPQMLAIAGEISEAEIRNHPERNMLLRVIGVEWEQDMFEVMKPIPERKVQAILLCSDGFWELIDENEMCKTLAMSDSVEDWLERMKAEVKANGMGRNNDNCSAIAIWV